MAAWRLACSFKQNSTSGTAQTLDVWTFTLKPGMVCAAELCCLLNYLRKQVRWRPHPCPTCQQFLIYFSILTHVMRAQKSFMWVMLLLTPRFLLIAKITKSHVRWHSHKPRTRRLRRQNCHKFGVSLGYMGRPVIKKKKFRDIFNTSLKITIKVYNYLEGS